MKIIEVEVEGKILKFQGPVEVADNELVCIQCSYNNSDLCVALPDLRKGRDPLFGFDDLCTEIGKITGNLEIVDYIPVPGSLEKIYPPEYFNGENKRINLDGDIRKLFDFCFLRDDLSEVNIENFKNMIETWNRLGESERTKGFDIVLKGIKERLIKEKYIKESELPEIL